MTIMTCETCKSEFEGHPNQKYCSADCRRKAEMAQRAIKRKARLEAWLAAMSPEEREWYNSIPNTEDLFGDLPPLNWPELKSWDDLPVTTWDKLLPWEPLNEKFKKLISK